ncbi:hypothetical protein GXB85_02945 [Cellulomonas sp. APG4]|uniref:hypothetical protein n=1 Tax=Cellulomonas sp. APG4 TaxID=1538656 RepID=UPI00137A608F|nr:hypothetical protein [Cellulomonas sp. APG4]NCT89915.1 hypothetical protein [Cellulomonas sp. APG4]
MSRAGAVLTGSLGAAAATLGVRALLDRTTGMGDAARRWTRVNHRGADISLLEGPAVGAGLVAGALLGGGGGRRTALAGALAAAGGAAFGLVDDLSEDASRTRKGLRGHLGALAHGELTTGGLKVLGIGATSLVAAAVLHGRPVRGQRAGWLGDVVVSGALVAAAANLVNLLDLRPGRALKAGAIAAAPALVGAGAPLGAACVGAAAAALGPDLAERDMLGDGGANALGALVGTAAVASSPRPVRLALLAGAVGLTLASERVSFTDVIARTPALRTIDEWGRR